LFTKEIDVLEEFLTKS